MTVDGQRELRFVSLDGLLGYGYPEDSLRRAMELNPHFVGVDAGSTDPGPYYLGNGTAFVRPAQIKRDLALGLRAALDHSVPLIVGTAGGSGARPHVETFLDIVAQIAREDGRHFRVAVIWADIDPAVVIDGLRAGKIQPCGPVPALTEQAVRSCVRIVGQMGTGPIIRALATGADVIVAGRACDTAVFAAPAIRAGFDPGLALHLGKIAECGALCAEPQAAADCIVGMLREDHFLVWPPNPARRCTPDSVAAHSLYEQPDPDCFYEPEGKVDLTGCTFEDAGDGWVKVSGSKLIPSDPPTIKLEGVALRGYRSVSIAGIRDPRIIEHIDDLESNVRSSVAANLKGTSAECNYSLRFIRYGLDGTTWREPAKAVPWQPSVAGLAAIELPAEIGLVIEAVAPTQELADTVVALARATSLHQSFAGRKTTAGNLAFPFSPSDLQGGPVYEFAIYHLLETADPDSLFRIEMREM